MCDNKAVSRKCQTIDDYIDKGVPALSYLTANVLGEMHGQIFGYVYSSTQHTVCDTVLQGWESLAMAGSVVDW